MYMYMFSFMLFPSIAVVVHLLPSHEFSDEVAIHRNVAEVVAFRAAEMFATICYGPPKCRPLHYKYIWSLKGTVHV